MALPCEDGDPAQCSTVGLRLLAVPDTGGIPCAVSGILWIEGRSKAVQVGRQVEMASPDNESNVGIGA
jgi:hypothetical protein